jgi:glucose-6-phosphate 1-epimerase
MQSATTGLLNQQYALPGHVQFQSGPGGLVTAVVENDFCHAAVTLAGAHVISYQPKGRTDVFWMSPNSAYSVGKPIRGGIPVCWPWFGPHPFDPHNQPMHGFARISMWTVNSTCALQDGSTEVRLGLHNNQQSIAMWPHAFELELVLTFGTILDVDLLVRNPGEQAFQYNAALHHYFQVSDVRKISISGLEDTDYLDKVENFARKHQDGAVVITAQTDRIYLDTINECVIEDPGLRRAIHIAKAGSRTTVVWNPAERAAQMLDIGAGNENVFVCVETANAADDIVEVPAGAERHLTARIWLTS